MGINFAMQNRILLRMVLLAGVVFPVLLFAGGPDLPPEPEGHFSLGFTEGAFIYDNTATQFAAFEASSAPGIIESGSRNNLYVNTAYKVGGGVNLAYRFANQNDLSFNFFYLNPSNFSTYNSNFADNLGVGPTLLPEGWGAATAATATNVFNRELLQYLLAFGHWFSIEPHAENHYPFGAYHPFIGLEVGTVHQSQVVSYADFNGGGTNSTVNSSLRFTGVGPAAGLDLVWGIYDCLSFDGRGFFSVLYAKPTNQTFDVSITDPNLEPFAAHVSLSQAEIIPHFHGELGLAYVFACTNFSLKVSAGYQADTYLGEFTFVETSDRLPPNVATVAGMVGYAGPYVRIVFTF